MISPEYKKILLGIGENAGSTRQAITKRQIQDLEITYPDKEEQQTIARKIENIRKSAEVLKSLYSKKLRHLEGLKQSMLEEAFRGGSGV